MRLLTYYLPVAKFLSVFAFVTWIRPKSVVLNQLFGGTTGLSIIPITFDVRIFIFALLFRAPIHLYF